jgi:hypothetical protein
MARAAPAAVRLRAAPRTAPARTPARAPSHAAAVPRRAAPHLRLPRAAASGADDDAASPSDDASEASAAGPWRDDPPAAMGGDAALQESLLETLRLEVAKASIAEELSAYVEGEQANLRAIVEQARACVPAVFCSCVLRCCVRAQRAKGSLTETPRPLARALPRAQGKEELDALEALNKERSDLEFGAAMVRAVLAWARAQTSLRVCVTQATTVRGVR